ncbi:hypothetical protein [Syntrophus aciditrophicus]|uniref:Hypothetical membrane protein n=1 Tax=Syntrophus aciditrophicus (strain SB) TaxID=56780 RepID=Q2LWM0_SYNAS|nr:hypothetical protein [Syntrophus aciditrophicus]ABC78479.1 hypothetical membrane protein [Syntrophus aciditrophicus SB]
MSLMFLLPWCVLLYFSSKVNGYFLFFFVLFQFIFIGIGLCIFPYLGSEYISNTFTSFNLSSINDSDFKFANYLLLICNTVVVLFFTLMTLISTRKGRQIEKHAKRQTRVRSSVVVVLAILASILSIKFLAENIDSFSCVLLASSVVEMSDFVDLRRDSTSNYLITIMIYNVLPATAMLSLLLHLQKRKTWTFTILLILFLLVTMCLLMTFQKRPLLVFWGAMGVAYFLWKHSCITDRLTGLKVFDLLKKQKLFLLICVVMLFVFYYLYTGYRFENNLLNVFPKIGEIVFTRLIGRLSIPAAMYIDFFPGCHDFYGLSNVGMFSRLLDTELFRDTGVIFMHYSGMEGGAVAASVFFDAYGQGGLFVALIYSFLIAIIILLMDYIAYCTCPGTQRVFFVVSGFIFIYYLSQSSLFRAAFGYGWFFYLLVWLAGITSHEVPIKNRQTICK